MNAAGPGQRLLDLLHSGRDKRMVGREDGVGESNAQQAGVHHPGADELDEMAGIRRGGE